MKRLILIWNRLTLSFIILLALSCKTDNSLDDYIESVYSVNFSISQLSTTTRYLSSNLTISLLASNGLNSNLSEGYLYYWSFNNENLTPDIKYDRHVIPSITYNNGVVPSTFYAQGYAYDSYVAGKSLGFVGAKEVFIKMPIKDVLTISRLGFDIGSPNTGPKDFEISYSLDEGDTYQILSSSNQFGSLTANAKNSFTYDLDSLPLSGSELWIRLVMKAGERGNVGKYNESSGGMRLDNFHLVGIAHTNNFQPNINQLHYFVFHKNNTAIKFINTLPYTENMQLELSLPLGEYDIFFVTNSSNEELILPNTIEEAQQLYCSNRFSNSMADIFAYTGTINVQQNQVKSIELVRMYSQIKLEFTDASDLSVVKKIGITQLHEPFYYMPFNSSLPGNPILDQSSIQIDEEDVVASKQIVFNQFMGFQPNVVPLSYTVEVYGANGIIRTFQLHSSIKNNMQLVFRGELLNNINIQSGFQIIKNENWDGTVDGTF